MEDKEPQDVRPKRQLKMTEKGQEYAGQIAERDFWKAMNNLDRYGDVVKEAMTTCFDPKMFKNYLLTWMELCNKVKQAEAVLHKYISRERHALIRHKIVQMNERCTKVKIDAYKHLDSLTLEMEPNETAGAIASPGGSTKSKKGHSPQQATAIVQDVMNTTDNVEINKMLEKEVKALQTSIQNVQNEIAQLTISRSKRSMKKTPMESSPASDYNTPLKLEIPQRYAMSEPDPIAHRVGLISKARKSRKLDTIGSLFNMEPKEEYSKTFLLEDDHIISSPENKQKKGRVRILKKSDEDLRVKPSPTVVSPAIQTESYTSKKEERMILSDKEIYEDMMAWHALKQKYAGNDTIPKSLKNMFSEQFPGGSNPTGGFTAPENEVRPEVGYVPPTEIKPELGYVPPTTFHDPRLQSLYLPSPLPPPPGRETAGIPVVPPSIPVVPPSNPFVPPGVSSSTESKLKSVNEQSAINNDSVNMCLANALMRMADVLENKDKPKSSAEKVKLPTLEPSIFQGDAMGFHIWLNSFVTLVEAKIDDPLRRLFYLAQYTGGKAKEAIQELLDLNEDRTAYTKAILKLKERYGNPLMIAEAFKKKIKTWQPIKEGESQKLQAYADFLSHCHTAMSTTPYLKILAEPEENAKLSMKLPPEVQREWNRRVVEKMYPDNEEDEPSYPSFKEFCTFVMREARIALGPCAVKTDKYERKKLSLNTGSIPSTEASEKKAKEKSNSATGKQESNGVGKKNKTPKVPFCLYCKEKQHWIQKCSKFIALEPVQRRDFCTEKVICYGCLRNDHDYSNCKYRMNRLLTIVNDDKSSKSSDVKQDSKVDTDTQSKNVVTNAILTTNQKQHYSTVVPVKIMHRNKPNTFQIVYALIDSQSDGCFVLKSTIDKLGVKGSPVELSIITMGQKTINDCEEIEGLQIKGVYENETTTLPLCYTKDNIPVNRESIAKKDVVKRWSHLRDIADNLYPYDDNIPVGLLLGYNCTESQWPADQVVKTNPSEPWGVYTKFGWVVAGPVNGNENDVEIIETDVLNKFCYKTIIHSSKPKVEELKRPEFEELRKALDLDFAGEDSNRKLSYEDKQFLDIMEKGFRIDEEGHVELPLPVRKDAIIPKGSRKMSFKRFKSQERKFKKEVKLLEAYLKFFGNMFGKNQAEKAPKLNGDELLVWTLPHQIVYHSRKPDKPRVVYDGSAEVDGISLNDILLPGPDFTNNLVGILLRFREAIIAFMCDILGMFHQVKVAMAWRNLMRFFWYEDNDPNKEVIEYRVTVHLFGATSSPACATFALRKVADLFENLFGKEVADFIRTNFYVDDGLKSVGKAMKAVFLILNSHDLCLKGGFVLHEFISNSKEVIHHIPEGLRSKILADWKEEDDLPKTIALGQHWCLKTDCLLYIIKILDISLTRRGLLSAVGSVYDPLGLLSPVLLKGRLMLQDLCHEKLSWDQLIDQSAQEKWNEWYLGLTVLESLKIPRCYMKNILDVEASEIHMFCDASGDGYGAQGYLVLEDELKNRDISLVMGKSRVKPNKKITTPRLELQAAVLSAKMLEFLIAELPKYPNMKIYMWTDSMIVIAYVTNSGTRYRIYVANRVQSIRDRTDASQWGHVTTEENPADITSRGCLAEEIMGNRLYWEGPDFLKNEIVPDNNEYLVPEDDPEVIRDKVIVNTTVRCENSGLSIIESLKERTNSWLKMVRFVMMWRRWFRILYKKAQIRKGIYDKELSGLTDVEERHVAKMKIVRLVQIEEFPRVMRTLPEGYPVDVQTSYERKRKIDPAGKVLLNLDAFLCETDGVLKVGGRIQRSDLPLNEVHPVILPKKHPVTNAIIDYYHSSAAHAGRYSTIHLIRSVGWWIVNARSQVESVLQKCVVCKKIRGKVSVQKMASLPNDRLETVPPFTYCCMDCFGPFYVKEKRSTVKRWACLFSCLLIRAVHVEICHEMSTDSFMLAYRRFVNKRGPVRSIRCDRGSNFMGARGNLDLEFAKIDQTKVKAHLLNDDCDWVTIIPNAPKASHMGGVWERMIGSIRRCLDALLFKYGDQLTDETLLTLMSEAEGIVNNRPITYVDLSTPQELQAISPAMLLTMKTKKVLPPIKDDMTEEDVYARERWIRVQYIAGLFWDKWKKDYLTIITQRSKWQSTNPNLQEGDIVLIVENNLPRSSWPMARVVSVKKSDDGLVRTIMVRTKDGIYCRPIAKVVLLFRPQT